MTKLVGKELFIRFTASAFRKLPSVYVFSYFPLGFEGRLWDLIVSVPDHCLSFYFEKKTPANLTRVPTTYLFLPRSLHNLRPWATFIFNTNSLTCIFR